MDDDTLRLLLRALLDEDRPGRGRVRRWVPLEAAERVGLVLGHGRRGLQALREREPPLAWGGVDGVGGGEELWWLLADGDSRKQR